MLYMNNIRDWRNNGIVVSNSDQYGSQDRISYRCLLRRCAS